MSIARLVVARLRRRSLRPAWALAISVFVSFTFYRLLLWTRLAKAETPPFGFVVEKFWLHEFLASSAWDVLVTAALSGPFFLYCSRRPRQERSVLYWSFASVVAFLSALLSIIHLRMILDRGEGLGVAAWQEAVGGAMTVREAWSYGAPGDYAALAFASLSLPMSYFLLKDARGVKMARFVRAALWGAALLLFCGLLPEHRRFPNRVHHNPVQYGLGEWVRYAVTGPPDVSKLVRQVSPIQKNRLHLVDPEFVAPSPRSSPAYSEIGAAAGPLNIVVVIMESTGSQYIFEETPDGRSAMPFLEELTHQGWWMPRHYSVANSSHRSLFSIFSGLYPSFGRAYFCLTEGVQVPTLSSFLPESYERFLYTPGQLRSYFPKPVFINSGFSDLNGQDEIAIERPRPATKSAHNELDVLDRFKSRLRKAKGPFLGVYYSYVPHFHYSDYGPQFRPISSPKTPRDRYINNLRVLDYVISEIVSELKKGNRWDNTLLLIVGDHGEAFGQHEFFTHANDSHEESLRTPWYIRFPGIIPTTVEEPTSHVDVLPTVLSLLKIPYEPGLFQGESLLNPVRSRRYIFTVGNEQTFTSVSPTGSKVLHNFRRDFCHGFDLLADPQETHPLPCDQYFEQSQALANFSHHQTEVVLRYNESIKKGEPTFHGLSHPGLRRKNRRRAYHSSN